MTLAGGRADLGRLPPCGQVGRLVQTWTALDLAHHACLDYGRRLARHRVGGIVVAHLRGQLVFPRQLPQHAGFINRVRQRLLHEGVFLHPHRHGRRGGMTVVGRAHGHRVDALLHFLEHLAKIVVLLGLGEGDRSGVEVILIDVADRHHVARPAGIAGIAQALAVQADTGHGDPRVGRAALLGLRARGQPIADARGGGGLQKLAASRHK